MRTLTAALVLLVTGIVTPAWSGLLYAQQTDLTTYRLKPEDIVAIRVLGEPELSFDAPISLDGTISYPFLGFIKVEGMTVFELQNYIRSELITKGFYTDPYVTVNVGRFRATLASAVGFVGRSGQFSFRPGERLLSLLSQAQGPIPDRANLKKATLVRSGSVEQIPVDLEALLFRADLSQNYELQDGDILTVPENTSNRINILGFVARPGQYLYREGMLLADAISLAGGEIPLRSRMSAIQIQREVPGRQGVYTRFKVNFTLFTSKNDPTQNIPLQPGDFIFVPANNNIDLNQVSQIANILFSVNSIFNRNFFNRP